MLRKLRRIRLRLPVLTLTEKTALVALVAILSVGGGLRAWETSGRAIGPVRDWESLRQLVTRARDASGNPAYPCLETASFLETEGGGKGGSDSGSTHRGAGRRAAAKTLPAGPVDLNTAGEKDLRALPGVGPSTARAIVAHRAAHGKFKSADDLLEVKGIGPKKLEALRKFVRTGAPEKTAAQSVKTAPRKEGD